MTHIISSFQFIPEGMLYVSILPCKNTDFIRYFINFASWIILKRAVIKRAIKILWRILVALVTFLIAGALLIQLPQVQTFVTNRLMESLTEKFDGDSVYASKLVSISTLLSLATMPAVALLLYL